MTSLQTTQAYQVTYDYGKEGALVDALLGGDVPERRTPRKANQAQVAALPDDDDDGSFGESDDDEAEQQLQTIQQKVFSPEKVRHRFRSLHQFKSRTSRRSSGRSASKSRTTRSCSRPWRPCPA